MVAPWICSCSRDVVKFQVILPHGPFRAGMLQICWPWFLLHERLVVTRDTVLRVQVCRQDSQQSMLMKTMTKLVKFRKE